MVAFRIAHEELDVVNAITPDQLVALDDAIGRLATLDRLAGELVKLRYFAGLSHQDTASAMNITRRAADRLWALAKAWLYQRMTAG